MEKDDLKKAADIELPKPPVEADPAAIKFPICGYCEKDPIVISSLGLTQNTEHGTEFLQIFFCNDCRKTISVIMRGFVPKQNDSRIAMPGQMPPPGMRH